eukprot:TRINITY_DN19114_c0_g1_i1.p1 TRINITY_DN19114_c0_g1~~TRINITY_DN19114_c0_g1_i1.p1  ORF type:complete len:3318 (+),score=1230.87 TRINITY_DN19114_c0_g1_i1:21-9974(+)
MTKKSAKLNTKEYKWAIPWPRGALTLLTINFPCLVRLGNLIKKNHVIFKLENMKLTPNEDEFVQQLSLAFGRGEKLTSPAALAISGKDPWLTEICPEVIILRDVSFLTAMLMCHSADALPSPQPYRASDASLKWAADLGDRELGKLKEGQHDKLIVRGFGKDLAPCKVPAPKEKEKIGKVDRFINFIKGKKKRNTSHACPAILVKDNSVRDEEDVLYVNHLPTFNDTLGPQASEQLLSFLTAPNLRIVLLLTFFASHDRIHCLEEKKLQEVVLAALFEPGPWRPTNDVPVPPVIPAKTRDHLETPTGYLFDELCKAPTPVLKACLQLLSIAQEKCTGRYTGASAEVILFTVRLVCRVHRYLHHLVNALRVEEEEGSSANEARGLQKEHLAVGVDRALLEKLMGELDTALTGPCFIRLDEWAKQAEEARTVNAACKIHAHLVLLFQHYGKKEFLVEEKDPERRSAAATVLAAQVYISTYHNWGEGDEPLGASEMEVSDVFEKLRRPLYWAMLEDDKLRDEALEAAKNSASGSKSQECQWAPSVAIPGAFLDSARNTVTEEAMAPLEGETYLQWLQRTASANDAMCINMNNGVFSHKKDDIGTTTDDMQNNTDFTTFFGEGRMKCAALSSNVNRKIYRLLGTERGTYDIHVWEPDERPKTVGLELIGWSEGSAKYTSGPDWAVKRIQDNINSGGLALMAEMDLRFLDSSSNVASFGGVHPETGNGINVVTIKTPPVTNIYQVTECGRRFYLRQVFTTDSVWSYHSPHHGEDVFSSTSSQRYFKEGPEWTLCAGSIDDDFSTPKTLQIIRTLNDKTELYLPTRLLLGALPAALLEAYEFWQELNSPDQYGPITGEARSATDNSTVHVLLKDLVAGGHASVHRTQTDIHGNTVTYRLMNLLDSRKGKELAECFTRLENLSHILVWCTGDEHQHVKRVELPRLSLSFTVSKQKLCCEQVTGYYIYQEEYSPILSKLIDSFGGGCIILTKESGECAILTSAVAEPLRPDMGSLVSNTALSWIDRRLPMQLLFRRSEPDMVKCLTSDARHHMYPVHHSHHFLKSPTAPSMLYLMLCLALRRKYPEVAEMGCRLGEVRGDEEFGLLKRVVDALLDDKCTPDAIACRLKLSLSIAAHSASFVFEKVRKDWSPVDDIQRYMRRRADVSPAVALSMAEESEALANVRTNKTLQCRNREACLYAMLRGKESTAILYSDEDTNEKEMYYYDCLQPTLSSLDWIGPSLSSLTHETIPVTKRNLTEMRAIMFLDRLQRKELINLVLVYDVFKGDVAPKIVATDSSALLGTIMARLINFDDPSTLGLQFMHVLDRAAEMDPGVIDSLPQLPTLDAIEREMERTRPKGILGGLMTNTITIEAKAANMRSEVVKEAVKKIKDEASKMANLDDERYKKFIEPRKAAALKGSREWVHRPYKVTRIMDGLDKVERWSVTPFITDVDVAKINVSGVASFENPLKTDVWGGYVKVLHEKPDTESLKEFKIILEGGEKTFDYTKTMDSIQNRINFTLKTPVLEDMTVSRLQELQTALKSVYEIDTNKVRGLEEQILETVNPESTRLQRFARIQPTYDMASIVRLYLSEEHYANIGGEGKAEQDQLRELITEWLFTYSRLGQIKNTVLALKPLISEVKAEGAESVTAQATMRAAMKLLTARRYHVSEDDGVQYCDPRMLTFEYMLNILLRKEQVKLIKTFMNARYAKRPTVHQMIMGQGKTTVIAPMLSLIIADGNNLVVLCMPKSLVNFSKSVMLDCFSSPVLPRPILTLDFNRSMIITEHLYKRVVAAVECRAMIVLHPTAIKSLLLKYVLSFEKLDLDVRMVQDEAAKEEAASYFSRVKDWIVGGGEMAGLGAQEKQIVRSELKFGGYLFEKLQNRSVMLMDEVDMLLHPLRSELNWPLGTRHPLDMTQSSEANTAGVRSCLPWFLFELIFTLSKENVPKRHDLSDHTNLAKHLQALQDAIAEGVTSHMLNLTPHITILSRDYYFTSIKPILCILVASWLQQYLVGMERDRIKGFLEVGRGEFRCSDREAKILNLAHDWLAIFLPHCLSKVHRVTFGVLRPEELARAKKLDPNMPRSRQLLAVPFVGKDTPSQNSEFQHPDIAIGLTIHSTMQDGLRMSDLKELLLMLQNDFDKDESFPPQTRRSALTYVDWMRLENACVKGYSWDGYYLFGKEDKAEPKTVDYQETKTEAFIRKELWQLTVVNTRDEYQMNVMRRFLKHSQKAIQYFLFHHAFPLTLIKASQQLSAAGQELASSLLSSTRLGFSGTPNDLLPQEMGRCIYADHDDGEMIKTLIDPETVAVTSIKTRDPKFIIKAIARGQTHSALIDTGALITGYTNREVAQKLFEYGLKYKGVVYLDADDRRMVHFGDSHRDLPIEQCGLAPHERFTFYDHIHTTGMDIKQPLECKAALTLSQDMIFRDYAQGAYRMRGIGIGQCIEVLVTPEINTLIDKSVKKGFKTASTGNRAWDVLFWLLRAGARAEQNQMDLLNKQNLNYLWKKRAFGDLIDRTAGTIKKSLQLLREPVKCDLRNKLKPMQEDMPQRERDVLRQLIAFNEQQYGALEAEAKEKADAIIANSSRDEFVAEAKDLEEEQVNEEEAEASAEKESEREAHQEQEHETEQEVQNDAHEVPEAAEDKPYVKNKLPVKRWVLTELQPPVPGDDDHPFARLSSFVPIGKERSPMPFPSFLMTSANYVQEPGMFDRPLKRQKNVFVYMEWVPNPNDEELLQAQIPLVPQQSEQLKTAFKLFCGSKDLLTLEGTRQLLHRMDLGLTDKAVEDIYNAAAEGGEGVSFTALEKGLSSMSMYKLLKGRYAVVVTLEEAEHIRALMQTDVISKMAIALHAMHMKGCLDSTILQMTKAYKKFADKQEGGHHIQAVEACFKFFDCISQQPNSELLWLLRLLRDATPKQRRQWWLQNRALKRRPVLPYQQLPVAMVLTEEAEYGLLQAQAVLSKMKVAMLRRRLTPESLFVKFDVKEKGTLSQADVEAGVRWLGINKNQDESAWKVAISALFKMLTNSTDANAVLTREALRKAFTATQDEVDDQNEFEASVVFHEADRPQAVEAAAEVVQQTLPKEVPKLASSGRFKIECVQTTFSEIWNSAGTACDKPMSLWKARVGSKKARSRKIRFGDFMRPHLNEPRHKDSARAPDGTKQLLPAKIWEVTDTDLMPWASETPHLDAFINTRFPHPIDYHLVWHLKSSTKAIYLWAPVPPEGPYRAAGIVATTTSDVPAKDYVRCMPVNWCTGKDKRMVIWKEASLGTPVEVTVDKALGYFRIVEVKTQVSYARTMANLNLAMVAASEGDKEEDSTYAAKGTWYTDRV